MKDFIVFAKLMKIVIADIVKKGFRVLIIGTIEAFIKIIEILFVRRKV